MNHEVSFTEVPPLARKIGDFLVTIITIFAYTITAIILLTLVVIPALIIAVVSGQSYFFFPEFKILFDQVFLEEWEWVVLIASTSGLSIILILSGIASFYYLFQRKSLFPQWINIVGILLLVFCILGISNTGIRFGSGFSYIEEQTDTYPLLTTSNLMIDLLDQENWYQTAEMDGIYFNNNEQSVGYGEIDIRVKRDNSIEQPQLVVKKEVSAKNPLLAQERISSFQYSFQQDSNTLYLSPFYQFTKGELREMDVDFYLILPDSVKVNTTFDLESKMYIQEY